MSSSPTTIHKVSAVKELGLFRRELHSRPGATARLASPRASFTNGLGPLFWVPGTHAHPYRHRHPGAPLLVYHLIVLVGRWLG